MKNGVIVSHLGNNYESDETLIINPRADTKPG